MALDGAVCDVPCGVSGWRAGVVQLRTIMYGSCDFRVGRLHTRRPVCVLDGPSRLMARRPRPVRSHGTSAGARRQGGPGTRSVPRALSESNVT